MTTGVDITGLEVGLKDAEKKISDYEKTLKKQISIDALGKGDKQSGFSEINVDDCKKNQDNSIRSQP